MDDRPDITGSSGSILGLDFETSGYGRWATNTAVEIGLVEITSDGGGRVLASSVLSGAKWISPAAYRTHGIGLWQCRGKPSLRDFAQMLESVASRPICVHGKGTERKILNEALGLHPELWVDSLTLSRRHLKQCPNHRLETVTAYLGLIPELNLLIPNGRWHRAAYDAAASALIVREIQKTWFLTTDKEPALNPAGKPEKQRENDGFHPVRENG